MFTLDANIFTREFDARHADHAICHALLQQLAATAIPMAAPLLILAEVAGALRRELGDPMRGRIVVHVIQSLPTITLVPIDAG